MQCGSAIAACSNIRFERGASSAQVQGTAPAEGFDCLRFSTGAGQDVQLSVRSPHDAVAFSVIGEADARDSLRFRSVKKTYELRVFQLFRGVAPVKYELDLAIR
ncbi:MAG: hypothetical protein JSS31_18370 [Proteobacteria bacterium]|nr:hypothetical protein [Pseudomonadota bacterium]MBS0495860.1 hypothetical protein [Pseudomonadota bacterium]